MKRLLIVCSLVLSLIGSPCLAIEYCKDFLEQGNPGGWSGGLKTFEDEWTIDVGGNISMDIWINDVSELLVGAGCFITYDSALVNITTLMPYDTANGGPWDYGFTNYFEVEPGVWFLMLGNLACITPDGDGDIILGKVTFECQGPGDAAIMISTIPGFDTVGGSAGTIFDSQITPNIVTIHQISCTVDADCDDNNLCTADSCDQDTGECVFDLVVECDDWDICTTDTCNPDTGECVFNPLDCNDWDACTADSCDQGTGECEYTPADCSFGYFTDFLEPENPGGWTNSLKTFDEEWTLKADEEIEMDIWLNDVPETMSFSGFLIEYDPSLVSIIDVKTYDGTIVPGPWDPGLTFYWPDGHGPGTYVVMLGWGGCVFPDVGGDIILGRVRFRFKSPGDATITLQPITLTDTVIGCSGFIYDPQIIHKSITLHQLPEGMFSFDIKPTSLNLKCKGVLPAAILGSNESDVRTIDPNSLRLTREGIEDGVAPIRYHYTDRETGNMLLKFRVPEIVYVLMLNELAGGTIPLIIIGETLDGTPIRGQDSVRMLGNIDKECHSDFDCDADVDGSDALTFKAHFGRSRYKKPCREEDPCEGDFDRDKDVDGNDAFIFKSDYGTILK